MQRILPVLFVLLIGLIPQPGAADEVVLGVLEHPAPAQQQRLAAAYGTRVEAFVRVAFRKTAAGWQAFESQADGPAALKSAGERFPKRLDWTIAFDGKALGQVASTAPGEWKYYSDIGIELIAPGQPVPRIGKPDARFQPWEAETPVYRPLVLLTRPNVADPDGWKPAALDGAGRARALAAFRAQVTRENPAFRFSDRNVGVAAAYRAHSGRMIVALRLDPKQNHDDGPPDEQWSIHWFVMDDEPRFLDRDLALIDAGDYDGDGYSELIFAKSGYNYDGYVLYDDDLRHPVEFGWSYN